jgi:hypothetical protein
MAALQQAQAGVTAVAAIHIQHHQPRYRPGDNADVGRGLASVPGTYLFRCGAIVLMPLPTDQRPLLSLEHRGHRPAAGELVEGGLVCVL